MSNRILRINQLLKIEVSQLILREIEFPKEVLVTVTRVETSPDLREAKVFISVMSEKNENEILDFLNKRVYFFQQKINKRLKMKFIPKIRFFKEEKTKTAARIEEILEKLKKEEK